MKKRNGIAAAVVAVALCLALAACSAAQFVTAFVNSASGVQADIATFLAQPGVSEPALAKANADLLAAITAAAPLEKSIAGGAKGWTLVQPLFTAAVAVIQAGVAVKNPATQLKAVAFAALLQGFVNVLAADFGQSTVNIVTPAVAQLSPAERREIRAEVEREGQAQHVPGECIGLAEDALR